MLNNSLSKKQTKTLRYEEYVDIFTQDDIVPSAAIKGQVLLFDTFNGLDPLQSIQDNPPTKLFQKVNFCVVDGTCTIKINGKEETFKKNTLVTIMPENTIFITECHNLKYFMVVLYPKFSSEVYKEIGYTYSNAHISLQYFSTSLTAKQMTTVFEIYNDIKRDILLPSYEFKLAYIRSLVDALVVKNISIHGYAPVPLEGDSSSRQYDVYVEFLSLLNKHAIKERSVQYYAQQLGISNKYLSFVCVSYSKKNASSWIDGAVIQKAKSLMIAHRSSLTEISRVLNFPSVSSFSRFFKRFTGETPKDYVKQHYTPVDAK